MTRYPQIDDSRDPGGRPGRPTLHDAGGRSSPGSRSLGRESGIAGRPSAPAGDGPEQTASGRHDGQTAGGTVAETGTTVVALAAGDAAVLAADRRASVGGGRFVTSKDVRKVEVVHPSAALAFSGAVGHAQSFVRSLRAETELYEQRRGEPMALGALATLGGNLLGGSPLRVTPLLAGVGADGPRAYSIDGGGGVLADDYAAGGSGMQLAYGVLEGEYEPGLSRSAARGLAAGAIAAASGRDTASGDGLTLAVVGEDGVELDEHADPREVAA